MSDLAVVSNTAPVMSTVEGYINTLGMDTEQARVDTFNTLNGSMSLNVGLPCDPSTGLSPEFTVIDCITTPGVRKGRNGQPDVDCQNTYLITNKGARYFTQSEGIARSVNAIAALYPGFNKKVDVDEVTGEVRVHGGVRVAVKAVQMPNGNTFKQLELIGADE